MANDGTDLEDLVSSIERSFLESGYRVEQRRRLYNKDGVQIAEFDIEVRGRVGTTDFAWLIECRDRPSDGAADGNWILELAAKRDHHAFHKVTAVSTTGFSPGALEYAVRQGVELREVKSLRLEEFSQWLLVKTGYVRRHSSVLRAVNISAVLDTPPELAKSAEAQLKGMAWDAPILREAKNGSMVSILQVFDAVLKQYPALYYQALPNGPPLRAQIPVNIDASEGPLELVTPAGAVSVAAFVFDADLIVEAEEIPLVSSREYRNTTSGESIAQLAEYGPLKIGELELGVEFQHLPGKDQTKVVVRNRGRNPKPRRDSESS